MSGRPFDVKIPQTKYKYIGFLDGERIGETTAVSAEKAANNLWWLYGKKRNQFTACAWKPWDLKIYKVINERKNEHETS